MKVLKKVTVILLSISMLLSVNNISSFAVTYNMKTTQPSWSYPTWKTKNYQYYINNYMGEWKGIWYDGENGRIVRNVRLLVSRPHRENKGFSLTKIGDLSQNFVFQGIASIDTPSYPNEHVVFRFELLHFPERGDCYFKFSGEFPSQMEKNGRIPGVGFLRGLGKVDFREKKMIITPLNAQKNERIELTKTGKNILSILKPIDINVSSGQNVVNEDDLIGVWTGEFAGRPSLDKNNFAENGRFYISDIRVDIEKRSGTFIDDDYRRGDAFVYPATVSYTPKDFPKASGKFKAEVLFYPYGSEFLIKPKYPIKKIKKELNDKGMFVDGAYMLIDKSFKKATGYIGQHNSYGDFFKLRTDYKVINLYKDSSVMKSGNKGKNNKYNNPLGFKDFPSSHWAYKYIKYMADKKIINGYPDSTFKPNATFSRAAFAKILSLSYGLEPYTGSNVVYSDVNKGDWFYPYVMAIDAIGEIYYYNEADGTKTYRPNIPIERADVAVALVKLLGLKPDDANLDLISGYNDLDEISRDIKPYVALAYEANIMRGDDKGNFMPHAPLTRAQACKVFAVVLEILAQEE